MKPASLRWFVLGYFALLIPAMSLHSGETVGISANWSNGDYLFQGGAPPWSLAFAAVGIALYILLAQSAVTQNSRPMPFLFRRWLAGLIDWFMALILPGSILGLVAVLLEYKRTGVFDFVIDRQQSQPRDWILCVAGVLLLMFVIMPAYFVICWRSGRPTPGSCVLGFRIVADEGSRLTIWYAYLRALLGSMALLAWPCWILAFVIKRDRVAGKFWLDVIFATHAEFAN